MSFKYLLTFTTDQLGATASCCLLLSLLLLTDDVLDTVCVLVTFSHQFHLKQPRLSEPRGRRRCWRGVREVKLLPRLIIKLSLQPLCFSPSSPPPPAPLSLFSPWAVPCDFVVWRFPWWPAPLSFTLVSLSLPSPIQHAIAFCLKESGNKPPVVTYNTSLFSHPHPRLPWQRTRLTDWLTNRHTFPMPSTNDWLTDCKLITIPTPRLDGSVKIH